MTFTPKKLYASGGSNPPSSGTEVAANFNSNFDSVKNEFDRMDSQVLNLSIINNKNDYTPATARAAVPAALRKTGTIITYNTTSGTVTEQFEAADVSQWATEANWKPFADGRKMVQLEQNLNYAAITGATKSSCLSFNGTTINIPSGLSVATRGRNIKLTVAQQLQLSNTNTHYILYNYDDNIFIVLAASDATTSNSLLPIVCIYRPLFNAVELINTEVFIVNSEYRYKSYTYASSVGQSQVNVINEKVLYDYTNSTLSGDYYTVLGKYINSIEAGKEFESATRKCTPYLDISYCDSIIVRGTSTSAIALIAYYDINKKFISAISGGTGHKKINNISKSEIPTNAVYIRCSGDLNDSNDFVRFESYKSLGYKVGELSNKSKIYPPIKDYQVVMLGDSQFETSRFDIRLSEILEIPIYNCAVGGTQMTQHSQGYDTWSGYKLSSIIASAKTDSSAWNELDIATEYLKTAENDDNTRQLNLIKSIDWSKKTIVLLSWGGNDYNNNRQLIKSDSYTNEQCYDTAMNLTISNLLTAYPHLQLIFIGCPFRLIGNSPFDINVNSDNTPNTLGKYRYEYNDKCLEVAKQNHVRAIDFYNKSGRNKYTIQYLSDDGNHPNNKGTDANVLFFSNILNSF